MQVLMRRLGSTAREYSRSNPVVREKSVPGVAAPAPQPEAGPDRHGWSRSRPARREAASSAERPARRREILTPRGYRPLNPLPRERPDVIFAPHTYRFRWMQMGRAGYRYREPAELDLSPEPPTLLHDLIRLHLDSFGYSLEQLADLLFLSKDELQSEYGLVEQGRAARPRMRVVR